MAKAGDILNSIPEFSATQSIKIAPNRVVPVTPRILRIVDTKTFQRLRQVRQLSLSEKVYPSATHTRFSHALGVYANMMDYLRQLDRFSVFHQSFDEGDYLAVILAGLLHDLGHYPCSHQLDHLPQFPKHENLTTAIIMGELRIENEDLSAIIREDFGIDPKRIADLLGTNPEPPHALLKQIIDSPNDADKCDYLPRDSYFCGVDYGTGFERERFIQNLVPSDDGRQLCIYEKGLMSAERFQLARYWMYRSVYWAHTVRALITMLSRASEYLRPIEDKEEWTHKLMTFSDHDFLDWLHTKCEPPGQELIEMVHFKRQPYKRLFTVTPHHESQVYKILHESGVRKQVRQWFTDWAQKKGLTLEDHHLIWDVPPNYKDEVWETFPIKLANGAEIPVAKESPVIDALSQAFLHGVRKVRLFCHPKLAELVQKHKEEIPPLYKLI